jgi:hypothetical protein
MAELSFKVFPFNLLLNPHRFFSAVGLRVAARSSSIAPQQARMLLFRRSASPTHSQTVEGIASALSPQIYVETRPFIALWSTAVR